MKSVVSPWFLRAVTPVQVKDWELSYLTWTPIISKGSDTRQDYLKYRTLPMPFCIHFWVHYVITGMTAANSPTLKAWYFFGITLTHRSTQKYLWYTRYMCCTNPKSKYRTSRRQLHSKFALKLLKILKFWTPMCNIGFHHHF